MAESIQTLEKELDDCSSQKERIDVLNKLAWALHHRDVSRSSELAFEALSLSESGEYGTSRYELGIGHALTTLGSLKYIQGDYGEALSHLFEASSIFQSLNDLQGCERAEYEMAMVYFRLGDHARSLEHLFEGLFLCEQLEDKTSEVRVLAGIGMNYAFSEPTMAEETFRKALQIAHDINMTVGQANILNNMGMLLIRMEQYQEAGECISNALKLIEGNDHLLRLHAALYHTQGELLTKQALYEEAEASFLASLKYGKQKDESYVFVNSQRSLGTILWKMGREEEAEQHLKESLAMAEQGNSRQEMLDCHRELSIFYKHVGDFESALKHYEMFHATEKEVYNEKADARIQSLQVLHKTELALKEAHRWKTKSEHLEADLERQEERTQQLQETNRELQLLANLDEVTGLPNRRRFEQFLEQMIRRLRRKQKTLCLVLGELDSYREISEEYGAEVGNACLKKVARVMEQCAPHSSDFVARVGGEEFSVILPGAEGFEAIRFVRRLQKELEQNPLVLKTPEVRIPLTVSFGITCHIPDPLTNRQSLLDIVDAALFEARRQGGNRFVLKTIKATPTYVC